jgi:hypothetical protein
MSCNVGGIERTVRILIGMALLAVAFFHVVTGALATASYVLAAVALLTGLAGFCPAWAIIGFNTCAPRHGKATIPGR